MWTHFWKAWPRRRWRCVVDLREGESIRRVSLAHSDPEKERLAGELDQRYPTDPSALTGVANVLRTGVPEWHAEISNAELSARARDAEHLRILRELGVTSCVIVPITVQQEVLGTIALVIAKSGRRYSEFDLRVAEDLARRAATAIENARLYSEAQQAIAVREQVLAIVSHDLRNQLGVIATGADLLARNTETATGTEARKPIDTIRRTTISMQHLVGDLLDMASIQAGRLSFEPEVLEIQPILEEACEAHEPSARGKGLHLKLESSAPPVAVRGDRRRILQVLGNLLGNAIKFSHRSGTILLGMNVGEDDVTVSVADTGPGIAREDLPNIFEAYRSGRRDAGSGTGLGLYIARGILQAHGGRIWAESEPCKGSTFFFTLHRARVA
jgi:signal transduction histidine kinase